MGTGTYKNTGIDEKYIDMILYVIKKNKNIEKAKIYGSRSKGNFKSTSDIDIAIFGKNLKKFDEDALRDEINEESDVIYFVDVVNYETIKNEDLKKNIDNSEITIYTKV